MRRPLALLVALASLAAACGGDGDDGGPGAFEPRGAASLDEFAERATDDFHLGIGTPEAEVGTQRVTAAVLGDGNQPVTDADFVLWIAPDAQGAVPLGPFDTVRLDGVGVEPFGLRRAMVEFPEPGRWVLVAEGIAGGEEFVTFAVHEVVDAVPLPAPGELFPPIATPTHGDPAGVDPAILVTDGMQDVSLDDALGAGAPVVLVLATPKFCSSLVCGPVVDTAGEARDELGDADVTWIHVEIYGDVNGEHLAPAVEELGLTTEPWTFVIDESGVVASRLAGAIGTDELVAAVEAVLA
jgi:hypothetical protein